MVMVTVTVTVTVVVTVTVKVTVTVMVAVVVTVVVVPAWPSAGLDRRALSYPRPLTPPPPYPLTSSLGRSRSEGHHVMKPLSRGRKGVKMDP